VVVHQVL
jgi:hypothetical protein